MLNHFRTNKIDRENTTTTTTTTNNLTIVSVQNSSKEELLDAHFMAKKVQK
jgi:hypothetical protein